MRSLNKIISITFFLIIFIVYVTCAPKSRSFRGQSSQSKSTGIKISQEKLLNCMVELSDEFQNNSLLEDFLHGLLKIKYQGYGWDGITNSIQQTYGRNSVLKRSTNHYYLNMFYTALEVGMPKFWTPEEYCNEKYWNEKNYCTRSIEALGCGPNVEGVVCLKHLYFYWTKPEETRSRPTTGTRGLSSEHLLEAIHRGSEVFRNLTDEELFEAITRETAILHSLSDHELSIDFYIEFHQNKIQRFRESRSRRPQRNTESSSYEHEYRQYAENEDFRQREEHQEMKIQQEIHLNEKRLERYGIVGVSFDDICTEYIRRKKLPKPFGVYYAMYLHETIGSQFDGSKLMNHKDYCEWYLTDLELKKLSTSSTSQ